MKTKSLILYVLAFCMSSLYAQQGNQRVTAFSGYSVDPPHFILNGNKVELTFSTNLSYIDFPVGGPLIADSLDSAKINISNWGPFYAEIAVAGTDRIVAFSDYVSGASEYHNFFTKTADSGTFWSTMIPIQQIASGTSIPSTSHNPSLRSAGNTIYSLSQSFMTADSGLLYVYKHAPPAYAPSLLFQPYTLGDGIFAKDVNYSAKAVGGTNYHLLSYYDNKKIYFQKSVNDGATVTPPHVIWTDADPNIVFMNLEGTDMDFDATGRVAIVWSVYGEKTGFVMFSKSYLAVSTDFGSTFTIDSIPGIYTFYPSVRLKPNGQEVITYKENNHIYAFGTDNLLSFTTPVRITDTATATDYHMELYNGNVVCAAWVDQRFGWTNEEIYYDTVSVADAVTDTSGTYVLDWSSNTVSAQVMPNPFSEHAVLMLNESQKLSTEVLIYDINGRLCERIPCEGKNRITLRKGANSPGIYYYQIRNHDSIVGNGKLVIL